MQLFGCAHGSQIISTAAHYSPTFVRSHAGRCTLQAEGNKRSQVLESEGVKIKLQNESEGHLIKVCRQTGAHGLPDLPGCHLPLHLHLWPEGTLRVAGWCILAKFVLGPINDIPTLCRSCVLLFCWQVRNEAMAEKEKRVLEAEGEAEAMITKATAEAESLNLVGKAVASDSGGK